MEYCGQILGWHYYSFIVWLLEYLSLWHYDNIWKGQFFFLTLSIQYCGNCILAFARFLCRYLYWKYVRKDADIENQRELAPAVHYNTKSIYIKFL